MQRGSSAESSFRFCLAFIAFMSLDPKAHIACDWLLLFFVTRWLTGAIKQARMLRHAPVLLSHSHAVCDSFFSLYFHQSEQVYIFLSLFIQFGLYLTLIFMFMQRWSRPAVFVAFRVTYCFIKSKRTFFVLLIYAAVTIMVSLNSANKAVVIHSVFEQNVG